MISYINFHRREMRRKTPGIALRARKIRKPNYNLNGAGRKIEKKTIKPKFGKKSKRKTNKRKIKTM